MIDCGQVVKNTSLAMHLKGFEGEKGRRRQRKREGGARR
jgi:hypothetical protein